MWNVKFQVEEGEQEKNDRGREKAKEEKRSERERDIRGYEGGKGGMKDRNNGMKDGRAV